MVLWLQVDSPEVFTMNVVNPVVSRQCVVDERVIAVKQVDDRSVGFNEACEEETEA